MNEDGIQEVEVTGVVDNDMIDEIVGRCLGLGLGNNLIIIIIIFDIYIFSKKLTLC